MTNTQEWVERYATRLQTGKQPRFKFNRTTYNRLEGDRQKEYDLDTSVPSMVYYEAWTNEEGEVISKSLFDAHKARLPVVYKDRTERP